MTAVLQKITVFMEMIKFSHTLFALPFALSGALLAVRGLPSGRQLLLIILAMVGARTAAMALNRLIDAEIDARNPRTAGRAIPAGLLSKGAVLLAIALSVALLLWSAAMLNPLCLKLSPIALFFWCCTPTANASLPWPMSCWGSVWQPHRSAHGQPCAVPSSCRPSYWACWYCSG